VRDFKVLGFVKSRGSLGGQSEVSPKKKMVLILMKKTNFFFKKKKTMYKVITS
jgi:hypothetical protein